MTLALNQDQLLRPDWPAPAWVTAVSTTRAGGVSQGCYAGLNLGFGSGDSPAEVAENRRQLEAVTGAPGVWLKQVHGRRVVQINGQSAPLEEADASWTDQPDVACVIQTADCLPLLVVDISQRRVAAIHGGWRGLAAGVVEATLDAMAADPASTLVWLGPCIGPNHFEVGADVLEAFCTLAPEDQDQFRPGRDGHWMADLQGLARRRLQRLGVSGVFSSDLCTYSNPDQFFSYRRDQVTGRMATLIAIRSDQQLDVP